ncbi:hypothetical protein AAG906_017126 [Vitis piasezkii]
MKYNSRVSSSRQESEGSLHGIAECPMSADERTTLHRPPQQVQCSLHAHSQGRGPGHSRNLKGSGGKVVQVYRRNGSSTSNGSLMRRFQQVFLTLDQCLFDKSGPLMRRVIIGFDGNVGCTKNKSTAFIYGGGTIVAVWL